MLRSIYLLFLQYIYIAYLVKKSKRFAASKRKRLAALSFGSLPSSNRRQNLWEGSLTRRECMEREIDEHIFDESVFERYREYLAEENTIGELWTSIIYTVDVVLDWIFVMELYEQDFQDEQNLRDLFIPSLIFAILGTVLYLLDAFDVFQWFDLCSSGNSWRVLFCNFMLEDLPQMVITVIAAVYKSENVGEKTIFTSTLIINFFTSIFALITKCVAIQESWVSQEEELIFPNLHRFVKKNQKLTEKLVKEDIPICPGKLERLINDINKGRECPTWEINVKTDMPGGVIALVQSFENIKKACVEEKKLPEIAVKFGNKSKMSTLEVSHLVLKMSNFEFHDVTWKLDLRECLIGTCTAKKRTLDENKILYEGNTIFGLQLFLRKTGQLLLKAKQPILSDDQSMYLGNNNLQHEIQVFRENATDVCLENIVLDEFVIKGLCHVLKFATDVTTFSIMNYYNNGITAEEARKQFELIKEEILRFNTKHITSFSYLYSTNQKTQWTYDKSTNKEEKTYEIVDLKPHVF